MLLHQKSFLLVALLFNVTHWAWDLGRWTPEVSSSQDIHGPFFSACLNWVPQGGKAWLKLWCQSIWDSRVAAHALHITLESGSPKVFGEGGQHDFWNW